MVKQLAERELKTKYGTFTERMFDNDVIVLTKGDIENTENVLCRVHSSCLSGHAFSSIECRCFEEMNLSQQIIEKAGFGIIIWLEQEGRGNGHLAVMKTHELKKQGMSQSEAYESLGFPADARSFEPAVAVINALGVKSIVLVSGSAKKAEELRKNGVQVSDLRDFKHIET